MGVFGSSRLVGPDHLKAILLVLVIFGHTFEAGVNDDPVKYAIYGFHMPLFLALSGYLLSMSRLATSTLPEVGRRYWSRMLWQWLAVSLAFELFMGGFRGDSISESALLIVTEPRYHLWYVPVLMAAIVILWTVAPYRRAYLTVGGLSALGYLLFATPLQAELGLSVPFDSRYLSYPLFVWLGTYVHHRQARKATSGWLVLSLIGLGFALHSVGYADGGWPRSLGHLMLNVGLALGLPHLFTWLGRRIPGISGAAVLMSTYSLWIYLLHPFATQPLTVETSGPLRDWTLGLAVTVGVTGAALLVAWLYNKVGVRSRSETPESGSQETETAG